MTGMIDINNLSKYEGNNRIEVKKAKGGLPNSLWETYSAFANTDGGIILLGVDEKEDHTLVVTGVEDVHKMKADFWNVISNKQKISLNILTERMVSSKTIEGKDILCVEVPKADRHHRPIYVGNDPMRGTYRRGFEGDYLCAKEEVAAMYRDSSDTSIDQKVLMTIDTAAFDMDTVQRYRNRFAQFHPAHIWIDDDDELFLRHIGAIALSDEDMKFHPTCAGLLMFGHEYDIVREYPHYFLDYQEKESDETRWTHRFTSSSGDWSGNLYDFFFRVYPRITADLPVPFVTKGMDRQDDTPLHLALRDNPERTLLTISVAESGLTVHHKEQKSGLRNGLTTQNSAELSNSLTKISEMIDNDAILLISNILCKQYSSTELLKVLNSARTQQELSKRSARSFVSTTLKMMIDVGLLVPLYPKTPHHPKQRYFLTKLGVEYQKGIAKGHRDRYL